MSSRSRLHICILSENHEWDAALVQALRARGIETSTWSLLDSSAALHRKPPANTVYVNRFSPSAFWRGRPHALGAARAVVHWLESCGRHVVNGSAALELEVSKVAQLLACRQVGLRFPYTEMIVGRSALEQACARWDDNPHRTRVMIKPNCGGSGNGVRVYPSAAALLADESLRVDSSDQSSDGVWLLQQHIDAPVVHRLEFVGGELLYAVRIRTDPTGASFNHCPCDGDGAQEEQCALSPRFEIDVDFPKTDGETLLVTALLRMLRMHQVEVAGIEAIQDSLGAWWIIDCNCVNTNYNVTAEKSARVLQGGHARLVDWLLGGKVLNNMPPRSSRREAVAAERPSSPTAPPPVPPPHDAGHARDPRSG